MTQINIIGNILDSSGYAIHTRSLASALSKSTEVKLSTAVPPGAETLLTDKELEMVKRPSKGEINLIITSPVYWKIYTNAKRNWVYLIFEGDKIPIHFLNECLNPDIEYILVASEHTRNAIINTWDTSGYDQTQGDKYQDLFDKIKIVPHGVDLNKFYPKKKQDNTFRFLCLKGFRNLEDRGGAQYFIKAYLEEFTNKDNVEAFLKINPAYGIPDINTLFKELIPNRQNMPPVKLNVDLVPYDKLVEFYTSSDVFVAPSRSDAFNIPGIEAMACGLPVITTNFGGQNEYCNEKNSWIIGGELTNVTWELQYEGIKWLTPDIKELRKAMREAYENRDLTKQKGERALLTAKEFTWDNTGLKIKSLI